jgi:enoyl-CoA hydratase
MLRVKEFLFTGDRIAPEQAVALGLANRVVPHDELMPEALKLAQKLARLPARALRDTKRALAAHIEKAIAGPMEIALQAEHASMTSPEHLERVQKLLANSKT